MTQEEWFAAMHKAVEELHTLSHQCDKFDESAARVAALVAAQVDLLEYTTNTSSYGMRDMTPYDRRDIRVELDEKVTWRVQIR